MKATTNVRGSKKNKNLRLKKREDRAIQEILQIEALETRMLLSGVGTGLSKKKVVFFDSVGDKVTVQVTEAGAIKGNAAPSFNITLDGGAVDRANIQSIVVHGDAHTALSVLVTPQKYSVNSMVGNAGGVIKYPLAWTAGITEIGQITNTGTQLTKGADASLTTSWNAGTDLRGIQANAAVLDNVNITGNLGGLANDIGAAKLFTFTTPSQLNLNQIGQIHFGNINVSGNLGALTLLGVSNNSVENTAGTPIVTTYSNDLTGVITVGGTLGTLNARFSNVLAPISANAIGSLQVQDIQANITATTSIGTLVATDLYAQVKANTIGNVALVSSPMIQGAALTPLAGDLRGTITATTSLGSVSVAGLFSGTVNVTNGSLTGGVVIGGTGFTGNILANGSIGDVLVARGGTAAFSGHIVAATGSVGNVTGGSFNQAVVDAGTSIGTITALNTSANLVTGTIASSQFNAHNGGIAGVNSAGVITGSTFTATGALGAVNVSAGGILQSTFTGSTISSITAVGAVTNNYIQSTTGSIGAIKVLGGTNAANSANFLTNRISSATTIDSLSVVGDISGNVINANGTIGAITSTLGSIGGGNNTNGNGITGTSIGNLSALLNISGNTITATTGSVGNLTATNGRIAGDTVTAATTIGNIFAAPVGASAANDAFGNGLPATADAIANSNFVAGTSIGNISGAAPDLGVASNGIINSVFTAGTTIGNINGVANVTNVAGAGITTATFRAVSGIGNVTASSYSQTAGAASSGLNAVTLDVTGTGNIGTINATAVGGAGITGGVIETAVGNIGNVTGIANTGAGITGATIHTLKGNIGNVTGISDVGAGITGGFIEADGSNIGLVTGISHGAGNGVNGVVISAGPGLAGTGTLTGVLGQSAQGIGINAAGALITAGTGGIGGITGIVTGSTGGNAITGNGSVAPFVHTTGAITLISGTSAGSNGIQNSAFSADGDITTINGVTNSSNNAFAGINGDTFRSGGNINNITASTSVVGASAILGNATAGVGASNLGFAIPIVTYNANAGSTIFSAFGNIGNITVAKGDVTGSVFVAGYDVGSDLTLDAAGITSGHDYAPAPNTKNTIGNVTVTNGNLAASVLAAGVVTTDRIFGNANDVLNVIGGASSGSTIGTVSVSGLIQNVISETDITNVSTISAGQLNNLFVHAFRGNIGDINVTSNIDGVSTVVGSVFQADQGIIGNVTVTNNAASGADAINTSTFYAGATTLPAGVTTGIGNVTALTLGGGGTANANAINASNFLSKNGIGNVSATVNNATGLFATAGITGSLFNANFDNDNTGSIGNVTAVTNGAAVAGVNGIDTTNFYAAAGIGNVSGTVTSLTGNTGILGGNIFGNRNAGFVVTGTGGVGNVTGVTNGVGNGLQGSVIKGQTIGNISGSTTNATATTQQAGISGVAATAVTTIGDIAGSVVGIGSVGLNNAGITGAAFNAGITAGATGTIGKITASASNATTVGNQVGIINTVFNAGTNAAGGVGTVGAAGISATASGTGALAGVTATALSNTQFNAGSLALGSNTIGAITASATASGLGGAINANGLIAGSAATTGYTGTIGAVLVTTNATATDNSAATATGLNATAVISAGNGDHSNGNIVSFTSNATAKSALGAASAFGVNGAAQIVSGIAGGGLTGVGVIGNVLATGNATALTNANAAGFLGTPLIYAGTGLGGSGAIGTVTGTANATATGTGAVTATATGIQADVEAIGATGTIGDVAGTATAIASTTATGSTGTATANGITGATLSAANVVGGVGSIGSLVAGVTPGISGTATATATTNPIGAGATATATGAGINASAITAGQTTGTVATNGISGTFTGTANGARTSATGTGLNVVAINAANTATGTTGLVGAITGTATTTANSTGSNGADSAVSTGTGIAALTVSAGAGTPLGSVGTVNAIVGTANVIATSVGTVGGDSATATGFGINVATITAGANGTGNILGITGTVGTLKASTTGAAGAAATANGLGLGAVTLNAGNLVAGGVGIIGNITGTVGSVGTQPSATATSAAANSTVYGIATLNVTAGNGALNNTATASKVGDITGNVWTNATAAGVGNATNVVAYGISDAGGASTINVVAGAGKGIGSIGDIVGNATAVGTSANSTAVDAQGIRGAAFGLTFTAGGTAAGGSGTIGKNAVGDLIGITGNGSATANGLTGVAATARGINTTTFNADAGGLNGVIGVINASATAKAVSTQTTVAGVTTADAQAIDPSTFAAGTGGGAVASVGSIGDIKVAASATVTAVGDTAKATAYGLNGANTFTASGGTKTGAQGTIGTITAGTVAAPILATATGVTATADAQGLTGGTVFNADAAGPLGTVGAISVVTQANANVSTTAGFNTATVFSKGLNGVTITAATLTGADVFGTGTIADAGINVTSTGVAVSTSGAANATVWGLQGNTFTAGGLDTKVANNGRGVGKIAATGGITATVFSSATSTKSAARATTEGIWGDTYTANGITGTIGGLTVQGNGAVTDAVSGAQTGLVAYATTADSTGSNAAAYAWGLDTNTINAANGGNVGTGVATGTVGALNSTVKVIATNTGSVAGTTGKADAIAVGILNGTLTIGTNAAGGTGNLGAINTTVSAIANDTVATGVVATRAQSYGINGTTFNVATGAGAASAGTLGNVTIGATAVANVAALQTGVISDVYGITGANLTVGTNGTGIIGAVSAVVSATNNATVIASNNAIAIDGITIQSGFLDGVGAGAGIITSVSGSASTSNNAASVAWGLNGTNVLAATSITGVVNGVATGATLANGIGIRNAVVQADGGTTGLAGVIGSITAASSGTDAISGSLFSSIQGIGAITTTGTANVTGSQFVAGISYNTLGNPDAGHNNATGQATIGAVNIGGSFLGSDLIAGVITGGDNVFGSDAGTADATVGTHGSITSVVIGTPAAAALIADGDQVGAYGSIEAWTIGAGGVGTVSYTVGGVAHIGVGAWVVDNDASAAISAGDFRVRSL